MELPPIDMKHLEAATFGDRALQREVLGLFETQAEKLMQAIRASPGRGRAEAAHALKGAARGIGAFAVADEAEKVEQGDESAVERLALHIAAAGKFAAAMRAQG